MLHPQKIKDFQKQILTWYKENKRDLPWRKDRDPYHILVSEVMLQQTQVSRVIPKYNEWMKKFPNVQSLANASTRDVLFYWSGLGYNRRALYLKRLAEELVYSSREQSNSRSLEISSRLRSNNKILRFTQNDNVFWPTTEKELMKLPGIGKYTASAILCFAFNKQIAVIDTNVRKVILTFLKGKALSVKGKDKIASHSFAMTEKEIEEIAQLLLPKGRAYDWNQALMDYAAAELKGEKIKIPKQSTFKNSDRYYRGQIIKLLTREKKVSMADLEKKLSLQQERLEKILVSLEHDKFIHRKKTSIALHE